MHLIIPPPAVFACSLGMVHGLSILGVLEPFRISAPAYVSVVLILLATISSAPAIAGFRRKQTTLDPRRPERCTSLVISGTYRFSRNPMYLGLLFLILAFAVHRGQLIGLISVPVGFMLYMTRFQIRPEEAALEQLYGDDYLAYKKRVRRWL